MALVSFKLFDRLTNLLLLLIFLHCNMLSQLGALIVMLLDHAYASKKANAKPFSRRSSSNDFYNNNASNDDDGNKSTGGYSTTTAEALQHARKAHDLSKKAQISAQLLVQGEEEEIDDVTRKARRSANARLKALHVHESLRDVIQREGEVRNISF